MGATTQPPFRHLLLGDIPKRVLRQAQTTTIVLKPARTSIAKATQHA